MQRQRHENRDGNQQRLSRVEHLEVHERQDHHHHTADRGDAPPPDEIRQVTADRNGAERQQRHQHHEAEHAIAREPEHLRAVGEDVSREDVERCLLAAAEQRRQHDLPPVAPQHFEHRRLLDPAFRFQFGEDRRLENAETDEQPDGDQDDARQERHAPAPRLELLFGGDDRHHVERAVRQHHAGGRAELRPARRESAPRGIGPLAGEKHGPSPLAADADALNHAAEHEQQRRPAADLFVTRHEADGRRRDAHQQQRRNQRRLPARADRRNGRR